MRTMKPHPPQNYRSFNIPEDIEQAKLVMNPDNDNSDAIAARRTYWDDVFRGNEVYFPMGIHHWGFKDVMSRFIPSGRYHTIVWYRLRELQQWVGNHKTWVDAYKADRLRRCVELDEWLPPRILYSIFALGSPVDGKDMFHFSFSQEIANLIFHTHIHFMVPNLRGQFGDKPEDWARSEEFWINHQAWDDAMGDRREYFS